MSYTSAPAAVDMIDERRTLLLNRISWGAIIAGVVTAVTVQLTLSVLGVGIGASALDATNAANNPDASSFSITAVAWPVVAGLIGSLVGGIVAGRLCGAGTRSTASWHGFVAWATTTLVVVALLSSAVGSIVGGTFNAVGSVMGGVGRGAASAAGSVGQLAQANGGGDALKEQVRGLINPDSTQSAQDDVIAYVRASVAGGDQKAIDDARNKAVDSVAKAANISPDEARARIKKVEDQARSTADEAKKTATQVAEATRKGVAQGGLYGFGALVLGAIAGWIGGAVGTPRRQFTTYAATATTETVRGGRI